MLVTFTRPPPHLHKDTMQPAASAPTPFKVATCALLAALVAGVVSAAGPPIPVFVHGEAGYPCIRTPSLVQTVAGSLLAFAGTRCGPGDGCTPTTPYNTTFSHQDAVVKRSTDGGTTWSPMSTIYKGSCSDRNHGCAVVDRVTGTVVFVFNGDPPPTWSGHGTARMPLAVTLSHDDGRTWSPPKPVLLSGNYSDARVSPGRGVQLRASNPSAPHRIVMVAQYGVNSGDVVFYSDDAGATWVQSETTVPGCNEAQIAELANGTLLMNARDESAKPAGRRKLASSHDGGATWTSAGTSSTFAGDNCMGSMIALDAGPGLAAPLLFSHPNQHGDEAASARSNGTVWISRDNASTFSPLYNVGTGSAPARARQLFAYSCLSPLGQGGQEVGLLYETGDPSCTTDSASCKIMFSSFTL